MSGQKQRIAIIGAGPAGLSTAFHLTSPIDNPGWEERYEVDVYTLGWRIGGKGATGRRADMNWRLQEHGIHVFGNMYFNSMTMVSQALDELRASGHDVGTMESEFLPCDVDYGMAWLPGMPQHGSTVDGHWGGRPGVGPFSEGVPWEGPYEPDPKLIVQEALGLVSRTLELAALDRLAPAHGLFGRIRNWFLQRLGRAAMDIGVRLEQHLFEERSDPAHPGHERHHRILGFLVDEMLAWLADRREHHPDDVHLQVMYEQVDLVAAIIRGIIADDLVTKGLDSVDDENYDDWLRRHGISEWTLRASAPQVIPNTALSYLDGDTTKRPTMAASAYLEFFCRQMTGKGTFAYFFREGTGETVMRPLYQALVQRGVRFHFFHKLAEVVPGEGTKIDRFRFDVQATPVAGPTGYDPFLAMPTTGEPVWPDRPVFDRLTEGDALRAGDEIPGGGYDLESWWTAWEPVGRLDLRHGEDFDVAVLATPIATLPHTCEALRHHDPDHVGGAWSRMMDNIHASASQAAQLWFDRSTEDMGWRLPHDLSGNRALGASYSQDLTTYCDFSELIEHEAWPADDRPKGLVYFIGLIQDPEEIPPFTDHDYPKRMYDRILWAAASQFRSIGGLLPGAVNPDVDPRSLDFDLLHDPSGATGLNRLGSQYLKANIDPNERYTISVKGTLKHRLHAWSSGFDNMALAGDWIYTGFNVGSFEGAVMSGKLASLAVSGAPDVDRIWGYSFMNPHRAGPGHTLLP